MLIDWFTVGAQVLNFLILVWLLKRFLYQPVLDAIDAREARIAQQVAEADAQQASARAQQAALRQKTEDFDHERAALLDEAWRDAQALRQQLVEAARQAAETLSAAQQEARRKEALRLNQVLAERVRREVFAVTRQTLADLATASLEERMAEAFVRRLRALDDASKASLAAALQPPAAHALVRSVFELPPAQRSSIQAALNDTFMSNVTLQFVTAPELVSGIELVANGQKLAWSIAQYLGELDDIVGELYAPADQAGPAASKEVAALPGASAP